MKIALCGSSGKMGKEVLNAFSNKHEIIAVCHDDTCLNDIIENIELVIDFTNGRAAFIHGVIALTHNIPIIIGSTGMLPRHKETLKKIANCREVGCILSSNFSIGITWIKEHLKDLKPYFETIHIEEEYHKNKVEAPGGTALALKEILHLDESQITSIRGDSFAIRHNVVLSNKNESITIQHIINDRSAYMMKLGECIDEINQLKGYYEYD